MSLKSMTGFGAGAASSDAVEINVEMKSVNNRFLDVVVRTPSLYSRFENEISKSVRAKLARGRVDISVTRKDLSQPEVELSLNKDLLGKYLECSEAIAKDLKISAGKFQQELVLQALGRREVLDLSVSERSETEGEDVLLMAAIEQGLDALIEMRVREGATLEKEVLSHLDSLEQVAKRISEVSQDAVEVFRERLKQKLDALSDEFEVDEARLAQEVAYLAERADITEELVRVASHIQQFRSIVAQEEGGRKLEFLLQEFLREVNTIGSKSQNAEVASLVVESKSLIEKIKEQVANIE
jgi:uncharacterized protein (TIGR00255 family)